MVDRCTYGWLMLPETQSLQLYQKLPNLSAALSNRTDRLKPHSDRAHAATAVVVAARIHSLVRLLTIWITTIIVGLDRLEEEEITVVVDLEEAEAEVEVVSETTLVTLVGKEEGLVVVVEVVEVAVRVGVITSQTLKQKIWMPKWMPTSVARKQVWQNNKSKVVQGKIVAVFLDDGVGGEFEISVIKNT